MNRHNYFEMGAFLGMFLMGQFHVLTACILVISGYMISPELYIDKILLVIYLSVGISAHIKAMSIMINAKDGSYVDKILSAVEGKDTESDTGAMIQGIIWRAKHEFECIKYIASLNFLNKTPP